MKKILLLIGCIFLITGCKVEYNLLINNDLTVSEKVMMTGTEEFFDIYYKSSKLNVINTTFTDREKKRLDDNGYQYEIVDAITPYVLAKKNYDNVLDFGNNTIFYEQYFEKIDVTNNDGIVSIKTGEFLPIEPDNPNRYDITKMVVEIKCAYDVIENNATKYDLKTNTYTWYIERDAKDFSINFSYDTNKIFSSDDNSDWLMIIGTIIVMVIVIVIAYIMKKQRGR